MVFGQGDLRLISVRETGIEVTTPTGRALSQPLNASNALLCDIGSQICKDAQLRRRREGYPIRAPMGWRWKAERDPNGRRGIERDEDQAEVVKFIIGEFLAGKSSRSLARELVQRGIKTAQGSDRWYRKLVTDVLLQPQHYGLVHVGKGEYVHGAHFEQRFFEPEDLGRVRRLLRERGSEACRYEPSPKFLLGGLAECGCCGTKLRGRRGQGRYRVYACQAEAWQQTAECSRNSCRAEWVEQEVVEHIRTFLARPEVREQARREARALLGQDQKQLVAEQKRLGEQLEKLKHQSLRWAERFNNDEITAEEFREYKDELLRQQEAARQVLEGAEQQLAQAARGDEDWASVEKALSDLDALWDELTAEERRQLVQEVIEKVTISRQEDGAVQVAVKPRFQSERTVVVPSFRGQVLAKRQMEALWLLGQGMTRKQVARQLG
jgi:hypothetical protein